MQWFGKHARSAEHPGMTKKVLYHTFPAPPGGIWPEKLTKAKKKKRKCLFKRPYSLPQ